jgi:hypothetical protein
MKLKRKDLKKLLESCFAPDGTKNEFNTETGEPCDPEYEDNVVNQEFESPIKDKIESDSQKQDQVMRVEENRYGLPFTNRDIRLLLLSYVDKIQEIAQSKDYSTLSQINSRVLNYIDNLQMKIQEGTAAYPAYSNKIDKNLSMFYYQSPDIGEDFKGYCRAVLSVSQMTGVPPVVKARLEDIVKQIIKMSAVGQEINFLRQDDARKLINKISSYQLLQLSKGITKDDDYTATLGIGRINLFEYFTKQRNSTNHILKIKERINASKIAIEIFQKSAEGAASVSEIGDDVGYQGSDLIEDFLAQLDSVLAGKDISQYPHFVEIQKYAEGELYNAMDSNDFRLAYKLTRKLVRLIQSSPGKEIREILLPKAQTILQYVDRLRFGLDKHVPKLVRSIRSAMEGFQTLFENKRRNKMKLNRKQLRKMIMEVMDPASLELEITPQIRQLLSRAHEALKMSGHPMPHVVLNSIMVDLKSGHPGELAVQVVNRHLENAGASLGGGEQVMLRGLPKF